MNQDKVTVNYKDVARQLFDELTDFVAENDLIGFGTLMIENTTEETKYDTFLIASKKNHKNRYFQLDIDVIAEINERLNNLYLHCMRTKTPFFVSIVKENSKETTQYINKVWSANAHDIKLTEDHFPAHILVASGFAALPPKQKEVESKFDFLLQNIELTKDQISKHVNYLKGYQIVPPNEYLDFNANVFDIFDDEEE